MTSLFYSNYQNFSPTLTNFSLGDGSCDCRYLQRYKFIHFNMTFTLGSGFSIGVNPTISGLPAFRNDEQVSSFIGEAHDIDLDETFQTCAIANDASSFILGHAHVKGNEISNEPLTATDPFTFVAGDKITISGTYETI